jgi:hypothetical protein
MAARRAHGALNARLAYRIYQQAASQTAGALFAGAQRGEMKKRQHVAAGISGKRRKVSDHRYRWQHLQPPDGLDIRCMAERKRWHLQLA